MRTAAGQLFDLDIEEVWLENEGDVARISNKCGISKRTVYHKMKKYCNKNGKNYQSYLRHPHKQHERHVFKTKKVH